MTTARKPGRPAVGPLVNIRLPPELLAELDKWAHDQGLTRAEAVRQIISQRLH